MNKGDLVPRFECTTIDDVQVNYADVWQKKNLALVCLSEDASPDAQSYIQELRKAQKALAMHDAIVVVTTTPAAARTSAEPTPTIARIRRRVMRRW